MRQWIENRLQQLWYARDTRPPWWLCQLERVYSRSVGRRRVKTGTDRLGVPVIVVGNLTVGGSGKTPLVIELCRWLSDAGISAGVVSRGYGRRGNDARLVKADDFAKEVGDEPLLIARNAGVPVAVATDRTAAVDLLAKRGVRVVVADDGLQHYSLPRQMEICVVDGERRFGNGRMLPAGPLREPAARLNSVDYVVVNGGDVSGGEIPMHLMAADLQALGDDSTATLAEWRGRAVIAVAAIGNPRRFFNRLKDAGLRVTARAFPDHHFFTSRDFDKDRSTPLVMTEKDAVKCRGLGLEDAWFLPVCASLPDDFQQRFLARVRTILERHAGNVIQT